MEIRKSIEPYSGVTIGRQGWQNATGPRPKRAPAQEAASSEIFFLTLYLSSSRKYLSGSENERERGRLKKNKKLPKISLKYDDFISKMRVDSAPKVKNWTLLKVYQNYQMQHPTPVSIQIQNNHNKELAKSK
ncbi:hypothetical protein EVAR_22002_1 [Eumeta japonica]|uniref:Uncharacterized protein n=1 Tax=Eumeta variegata TaxID=151549 RepID=A0A4C1YZN7_EUMVA|nr:hypothetical protein EVAR_22002_1 [Eumeta japonica]